MMNDNKTHVVGEALPLANGSDVLDRLMHLWAIKKQLPGVGGQQCGLEQYVIRASGEMMESICDAGDSIIALEKQLAAMTDKYAIAQHAADCLEAKCNDLQEHNRILMDAATGSLGLLRKGAPGWGQAKDILNWAIHWKQINTNDERNAL